MELSNRIAEELVKFAAKNQFDSVGPLAMTLIVTDRAIRDGLPMNPDSLLTPQGGSVSGLSGKAANKIFERYGIEAFFGTESGRTSRGMPTKMKCFVEILNELSSDDSFEILKVQEWWVDRAHKFFLEQPFSVSFDEAKSVQSVFSELLQKAIERQRKIPGTTYVGTVLQHLVGAKLATISDEIVIEHHGASSADAPTARSGDFIINETVIHVTTSPSEHLIKKCAENLSAGLRPIIVTTPDGARGAQNSARMQGIEDRIDIVEISQFLATNVYERSQFTAKNRRVAIESIIREYNRIIQTVENNPSLMVQID